MKDDFELFRGDDDGAASIDADVALVSAYLARELSPVQILAVEERLTSDPAFRDAMRPVFVAWAAPVPSFVGERAPTAGTLAPAEIDEGWARFRQETEALTSATPVLSVPVADRGSHSWRRAARIAAVTLVVALPVLGVAQAVVALMQQRAGSGGDRPVGGQLPPAGSPAMDPSAETRPGVPLTAAIAAQMTQRAETLAVTQDLVIRGEVWGQPRVSESGYVAIDGGTSRARIVAVFDPSGARVSTIGLGGPDGMNFPPGAVWRWVGDSVWIAGSDNVSIVQPLPKPALVRTFTIPPDLTGPTGISPAIRRGFRLERVSPDGSVITLQAFPGAEAVRVLRWKVPPVSYQAMYVRTAADGRFLSVVPDFLNRRVEECSRDPLPTLGFTLPFCGRPDDAISPDGRWFAHALGAGAQDASGTPVIRVTVYGPTGDTVFSRQYPVPVVPITPGEAEAERRALSDRTQSYRGAPLSDAERAAIDSVFRANVPAYREPVRRVLVGNDGTVFVEIHSRSPHHWMVLDSRGDVLGVAIVPGDITLAEVRRGVAWGSSSSAGQTVRLRIGR